MNKEYIVDSDGTVTVVTDNGKTYTREDKYTESTDMILSLENLAEEIENDVQVLVKCSNELCQSIQKKDRTIKLLNLKLVLFMIAFFYLAGAISTNLLSSSLLCSMPLWVIIGIVEDRIIEKEKQKRNYCVKQFREKCRRAQRVRRKIDELSRNKVQKKSNCNNFTEIKPISKYTIDEYTLDASDYFVEKYLIDKRAKEMIKGKKLVKKKTKSKKKLEYDFN